MNDDLMSETRIVEYLLGRASPENREAIEERYISDPDFLAEVEAVERDLVDQYVRGEMPELRAAFETGYLVSPSRREKVEFARALHAAPARVRPWWKLAAAAVLVAALGSWFLVANRPESGQEQASTETPVPGGGPGAAPAPAPPPPAPPAPPGTSAATPRVATVMLLPTLTRGSGSTPMLALGEATEVRVQLVLESAEYPAYRAAIRTAGGTEIWSGDRLIAGASDAGPTITLIVPAARFTSDDYLVRLEGIAANGSVEEIAGYYFRAVGVPQRSGR
jgi:hypothetical protein